MQISADSKTVIFGGTSLWVADLATGSGIRQIAPVSGTVNTQSTHTSRDGRRILVVQDRFIDGQFGLYAYGPSYADGEHAKFVPLAPVRVLDTRPGLEVGYSGPKPAAGAVVTLALKGKNGLPPNNDLKAVVLNVTADAATAGGFVTVWPSGTPRPTASNINLERAGQTRPNLVTVPIGADGAVSIYTEAGTHLIADLEGYYSFAANADEGRFFPLPPTRIMDTRSGAKPQADETVELAVRGRGGIPSEDLRAVLLTVTATGSTAGGFVTVWPQGPRPTASNLNIDGPNRDIANQVVVPVGSDGKIRLYTERGTHLIVDVAGWFTSYSGGITGNSGLFRPNTPTRVLDTRPCCTAPANVGGKRAAGSVTPFGYSPVGSGVSAYVANITMAETDAGGFMTAFPSGGNVPTASNLNVTEGGQVIAAHITMAVGQQAQVDLFTFAGTHLIADVQGTYSA